MNVDKEKEANNVGLEASDQVKKPVATKGDKNVEMSFLLSPKTSLG